MMSSKKRIQKRKIVFIVLTICWMVLIFSFSARDADTSEEDSGRVGRFLGQTFVTDFQEWPQSRQQQFIDLVDYPIRKTAHATEYAILGMLIVGVCYDERLKKRFQIGLPWMIGTVYAMTDEYHQTFVPGRSGQVRDVMIDSCGVLVGVLIIILVLRRRVYGDRVNY